MKITALSVTMILGLCSLAAAQGDPEALFRRWDRNGDGVLVIDEVPGPMQRLFGRNDRDGDGKITLEEHLGAMRPRPRPEPEGEGQGDGEARRLTVRQTWPQEPEGYDRELWIEAPDGEAPLPVVVAFHGNGGAARSTLRQWRELEGALLVAPQGYRRSWNIYGEASEAPDVAFLKPLLARVKEAEPRADLSRVTLVGTSNGAGLIYRLLIDLDERPFQKAVLLVSSLIEKQYHDGRFWSSRPGSNSYDVPKTPKPGPELLTFHGTRDRVVPYEGGLRGRVPHVSAQRTAFALARAFGHQGPQIPDAEGEALDGGLRRYRYQEGRVTHYKMVGGEHGLGRARDAVMRRIVAFLRAPASGRSPR
jgi:poly(3-hydroxybutyrate) depolymerase